MDRSRSSGFNLALVQMRVQPGESEANKLRARELCERAASGGSDIILLPEALPLGWTHPSARLLAEDPTEGPFIQTLREVAQSHQVHICTGLVEKDSRCGQPFNSALLIDAEGKTILQHRKIHELEIARGLYGQGTHLSTTDTVFGKIGIMICADAFIEGQVLSRSLAAMGAKLILSPCSWAVPADHDNDQEPYGKLWVDNYAPVARDFKVWIAGVSNVGPITEGPWKGRRCIGSSLVINPQGTIACQGPYGEQAEAILNVSITTDTSDL